MIQEKIKIVIFIDVTKALSEKSLFENIYMMDDGPFHSIGQASADLSTFCVPGQLIHWEVRGIDVQTPASITKISFLDYEDASKNIGGESDTPIGKEQYNWMSKTENFSNPKLQDVYDVRPEQNSWTGIVPERMTPFHHYKYQIDFQMGRGQHSILSINSPSLIRV